MDSRLVDILLNVSSIDTANLVKFLAVNYPQILVEFNTAKDSSKYSKVVEYMKADQIVQAIKEIRRLTGFSLKDSKDCVDYVRPYNDVVITDPAVLRVARALHAAYN